MFVPRVSGKDMEFYEISDISELNPGYRGIYEPDINGKEPDYSRTGFMCMPGLAFDRSYNRIGYGGGFMTGICPWKTSYIRQRSRMRHSFWRVYPHRMGMSDRI